MIQLDGPIFAWFIQSLQSGTVGTGHLSKMHLEITRTKMWEAEDPGMDAFLAGLKYVQGCIRRRFSEGINRRELDGVKVDKIKVLE